MLSKLLKICMDCIAHAELQGLESLESEHSLQNYFLASCSGCSFCGRKIKISMIKGLQKILEKKEQHIMFIFRADGNPETGAGHIMRCLSIADAAAAEFVPCMFVTADGNFSATITERGHEAVILDTDYSYMEGELEKEQFQNIIKKYRPTALIVDSYFVTCRYLLVLKKLCKEINCRLVYIDDVLAFPYPVDCLINYNIYGPDKRTEYERMYLEAVNGPEKEQSPGSEKICNLEEPFNSSLTFKALSGCCPCFLLGPEFAPLRAEFSNLPDRMVNCQAKNVLISTGGGDCEHLSIRLTEYIIKDSSLARFHFHLIIGTMNQDLSVIQKMADSIPNITLHYNVTDMQHLMSSCDVAISAAGSTLYELCAAQTPVITYILADNQVSGAEGFERHGVLKCAGDIRVVGAEKLAADVIKAAVGLADDYEERVRISSAQKRLLDGNGAERIIRSLKEHRGEKM